MNILNLEYISNIHPANWAGFFFPLLAALFLWRQFYLRYDVSGLNRLSATLKGRIEKGSLAEGCSRQNVDMLEGGMDDQAPDSFLFAWSRLRRDMETLYREDFVPEAATYFNFESLVLIPGGRKSIATLWGGFGILALLSLVSPVLGYFFAEKVLSPTALILGIWCLCSLCVGQVIFIWLDQKAFDQAVNDYDQFVRLFNRIVPVAGELSGSALLLEATARNQKAFEATAQRLSAQFDTLGSGVILPALQESMTLLIDGNLLPAVNRIEASLEKAMDAFSIRQDKEMNAMTEAFADKLSKTLALRCESLGKALQVVEGGLTATNKQLGEHLNGMSQVVDEQRTILQQAKDILIQTKDNQLLGNQKQELFNSKLESLSETAGHIQTALLRFTDEAGQLGQSLCSAEENLSANIQELQEQYTGLNRLMSDMMLNITERMNEAMAGAGREIGKGIQGASADNAQAISDLTQQASRLREDYDLYFGRLEDSTKQTMDDMDFHVQNITVKMAEEIGTLFKDIVAQNTQILDQYKDSTASLLQSFDEQARSIGLYAKEMNYDINELSANMKESVAVFSSQIQEGVNGSLEQFDSSLAELSIRIANTVESIVDAVENLPSAISGKK